MILAHLGGIPVEEWAPFWVPVIVLLVWGWRRERRGRDAVAALPPERDLLDSGTRARLIAACRGAGFGDVQERHLKVLYPPGPDGLTVQQIAERCELGEASVSRQLLELEEAGYLTLDGAPGPDQQAFLTLRGFDLEGVTEKELLRAAEERADPKTVARAGAA